MDRDYAERLEDLREKLSGFGKENLHDILHFLDVGTDFSKISEQEIAHIESLINNRPRKCLGFETPLEAASSFVALQG